MPTIHVLDAASRFADELATEMQEIAAGAAAGTDEDLRLGPVDVVVCDYPGLAIPGIGVGGYCPGPHLVLVAIERERLRAQWRHDLGSTVMHELHHAKRWSGPGYGARLLDSLVSEGLATLYEIERTGVAPPYADAVDDLEEWWARAEPLCERTDLHAAWFFGTQDDGRGEAVPQWTGYALGTELARRYCMTHGMSAGEAAGVAADEVRLAW